MHNLPDLILEQRTVMTYYSLLVITHYLLTVNPLTDVAWTVQLMSRVWNLGVSTWFTLLLDWSHIISVGFAVNLFVDVIVVLLIAWFGH